MRPWADSLVAAWTVAETADVVIEAFACQLPPDYVEAMLFAWLAQDEALGEALCEECKGMGKCLEGLTELSAWGNQP